MLGSFLRVKPDVRATHDHRDTLVAELAGYVVAADRMNSPRSDRHQIRFGVEIDVLKLLVNQRHLPTLGRKCRQVGKRERDEGAHARFEDGSVVF